MLATATLCGKNANIGSSFGESPACGLALLVGEPKAACHRARRMVIAEVKGAVLADYRVDRPEACDHIAPPRGPAGHRNDAQPMLRQPFERGIRIRAQPALGRQRVVYVEEDKPDPAPRLAREPGKRTHRVRQDL